MVIDPHGLELCEQFLEYKAVVMQLALKLKSFFGFGLFSISMFSYRYVLDEPIPS